MSKHRDSRVPLTPVAISVLALFTLPSWAQSPAPTPAPTQATAPDTETEALRPEDVEFSEEVVVTASRRPEAIATVPGSVTVITREQLAEQAQVSHRNLGDALGSIRKATARTPTSTATGFPR